MLYKHVEGFNNKSHFYSSFKKFWVVQNSFPIIKQLDSVNAKHNAKRISTFDFSTLYTTIPHCLLIDVLSEIIEFVFKSSHRNRIGFSPTSVYWTSKGKDKRFFTKTSLIEAVTFLIMQCYFTVGNLVLKQDIGIPMGIDPAPFWANLFLYFFESKFVQSLISLGSTRAYHFHSVGRFIDDLCAINDREEFLSSYKEIYPPELELKIEHQGTHATFLDLDITIKDYIFVYKLFDKIDAFPFSIVRMPHLSSNIPSSIFYGSAFSEILRIARCTLLFSDFAPRVTELLQRMKNQGGNINPNWHGLSEDCFVRGGAQSAPLEISGTTVIVHLPKNNFEKKKNFMTSLFWAWSVGPKIGPKKKKKKNSYFCVLAKNKEKKYFFANYFFFVSKNGRGPGGLTPIFLEKNFQKGVK